MGGGWETLKRPEKQKKRTKNTALCLALWTKNRIRLGVMGWGRSGGGGEGGETDVTNRLFMEGVALSLSLVSVSLCLSVSVSVSVCLSVSPSLSPSPSLPPSLSPASVRFTLFKVFHIFPLSPFLPVPNKPRGCRGDVKIQELSN